MNENAKEMEQTVATVAQDVTGINIAQVVKQLIANGAKRYNSIKVINVNATDKDTYVRISLTTATNLPAFIADNNGDYVEGVSNIIYTSNYALAGIIKCNEDIAMLANTVANTEKYGVIGMLLSGAKLDVVQVKYPAGEEVKNPFSTNDREGNVYDHDIIVNYIVDIELGKSGNIILNKIADQVAASFL